MEQHRRYCIAKQMRWAARVIGLAATLFLATMLLGAAIAEVVDRGLEAITVEGTLLGVLGVMALTGCVLSWWRERLAGILLVAAAVGFGIHIGVYAGRNHILVWLIMGLPYLVAGGLLFNSWWLSREAS